MPSHDLVSLSVGLNSARTQGKGVILLSQRNEYTRNITGHSGCKSAASGASRRARVCNCASMCVSSLPPRSKMDEAILHSPCFCFPPSQAEKERRRIRVRGHIRGVLTSVHITVAQWTLVLYRVHFGWTVAAGISNLLDFYTKSNPINALSQLRERANIKILRKSSVHTPISSSYLLHIYRS